MDCGNILTLAIPNKNGSRYLPETLRSLDLPSNRPYVRWWLQDCDSVDNSIEIATTFATSCDNIRSEPDAGQADGLNKAMKKMGGSIIGYLNSDDCLCDGAAEHVLTLFAEDPNVDIVVGEVTFIDENGDCIGHHAGRINTLEDILDIYSFWWAKGQWIQPEVFFRRTLFNKLAGYDTGYSLAFDFDFWVRALHAGAQVFYTNNTLVNFRKHELQRSQNFTSANQEIRTIVSRFLRDAGCSLTGSFRRRLLRRIEYDVFQTSCQQPPGPISFLAAIARRPEWLLVSDVRSRLVSSLSARLGDVLK